MDPEELLDVITTIISDRRMNAGQTYERLKREANDSETPVAYFQAGDGPAWLKLERELQSLLDEVEAVICDELGDDWRAA